MSRRGIIRPFPPGPLLADIGEVTSEPSPVEAVVPLPHAKVVIANYNALLHDFPHAFGTDFKRRYGSHFCDKCLARGRTCSDAIDAWLVANAAYVSVQQTLPNEVNSRIEHGPPVEKAFRPPLYGRALVLPVEGEAKPGSAGLLDVKGAGIGPGIQPSHANHHTGLEHLGVALGDYFYSWIVDRIFARTVPTYCTVPVYAVLDLGFDIVGGTFGTGPAGMHVRRAHAREQAGILPPLSADDHERIQIQMELLLRTFGFTSTTAPYSVRLKAEPETDAISVNVRGNVIPELSEKQARRARELFDRVGDLRVEYINLQLTTGCSWEGRSAQIVDFGHVHANRRFSQAIASHVRDGIFEIGRVIAPGDAAYVHPNPAVAADPDLFMRFSVNSFAFYAAQTFRSGNVGSQAIEIMLRRAVRKAGI